MFGDHLEDVRALMEIKRYQTKFKHKERTVAEHSWFVTKIAHGLAIWEKEKFGVESVDVERVMFLAMNHDIVEVYTGDILSTTKRMSSVLAEELDVVEEKIYEKLILPKVPKSWREMYMGIHKELADRKTVNSKLVKAGDLLDRVFECMEEIRLKNTDKFEDILREDLKSLYGLKLMSVNYFLKYSIKDIGAYEYIDKEIRDKLEEMNFEEYF